MKKYFIAALLVMFVSSSVFAAPSSFSSNAAEKENGGFVGIGYVNQALAVRVALSDLLSLEGTFGFRSGDIDDSFAAGGRVLYILKRYEKFNLYNFGGLELGYTNSGIKDDKSSSTFGASLGIGIEYFLVYNLSISAEMGIGAYLESSWHTVSTFGDWMSVFGFRYYLD
ncbi:MAG: porin family protein [Endomicrobium sp.]|jgi:opacity protein-like surface antigen|nr:porin family protein [Endomicrobium sp.]